MQINISTYKIIDSQNIVYKTWSHNQSRVYKVWSRKYDESIISVFNIIFESALFIFDCVLFNIISFLELFYFNCKLLYFRNKYSKDGVLEQKKG